MSDIASQIFRPFLKTISRKGLPLEPLVEGLPFSVRDLQRGRIRANWDDYVEFLERASRLLTPEELVEVGQVHVGWPVSSVSRALFARVIDPQLIYRLGAHRMGPAFFPCTCATHQELADGRVRQTIEIPPPHRDSPTFLKVMQGALETTPCLIGLDPAKVEMELAPRRAVYTIELPARHGLPRRLRRLMSWRRANVHSAFIELQEQQGQLRQSYSSLEQAQSELEEQTRRIQTLNELGRDLTRHTTVPALAESVLGLVVDQFGYGGAALARVSGDEVTSLGQSGELHPHDVESHPLRVGSQTIGRLDVSGPPGSRRGAQIGDGVLPWISLALNNALAFDQLAQQSERLRKETADRQLAQQQLHQAQKLEAVGVLAGGLAHDFNNLLTAIRGYADLASEQLDRDNPVRADLREIKIAGERGAALITQIMAFTRQQILRPQAVDLNDRIRKMERMLTRLIGERLQLITRLHPDLDRVGIDPAQFEQMLINLVVNSRDATTKGGVITIETLPIDGAVRLRVGDDGVGMNAETRARAFEPFFTSKSAGRGTGLGLSTVYGIVTQTGGAVSIESELGQGTTVTLDLPVANADVLALEPAAEHPVPGGKETILLVDDDEQIRGVTRRMLEGAGYTVIDAEGGEVAIELCRAYGEPIDLLLTDVVMPRIDGRELAQHLRAARPELRGVIYTSGYATEEIESFGALPADCPFLRKPFTARDLLLSVRRGLELNATV